MNFKTRITEQKRNPKVSEENYSKLSKSDIEIIEKFFKKLERKSSGQLTLSDINNLLQSKYYFFRKSL